jgi:hypothetical protein
MWCPFAKVLFVRCYYDSDKEKTIYTAVANYNRWDDGDLPQDGASCIREKCACWRGYCGLAGQPITERSEPCGAHSPE